MAATDVIMTDELRVHWKKEMLALNPELPAIVADSYLHLYETNLQKLEEMRITHEAMPKAAKEFPQEIRVDGYRVIRKGTREWKRANAKLKAEERARALADESAVRSSATDGTDTDGDKLQAAGADIHSVAESSV